MRCGRRRRVRVAACGVRRVGVDGAGGEGLVGVVVVSAVEVWCRGTMVVPPLAFVVCAVVSAAVCWELRCIWAARVWRMSGHYTVCAPRGWRCRRPVSSRAAGEKSNL